MSYFENGFLPSDQSESYAKEIARNILELKKHNEYDDIQFTADQLIEIQRLGLEAQKLDDFYLMTKAINNLSETLENIASSGLSINIDAENGLSITLDN